MSTASPTPSSTSSPTSSASTGTATTPLPATAPHRLSGTGRLWRAATVVTVVVVAAHVAGFVTLPSPDRSGPVAVGGDTAPAPEVVRDAAGNPVDGTNPVVAERARALAHLASVGTLDTWQPSDPRVTAAAAGPTAVLSGIVDGVCWYTAVDDGLAVTEAVDPTGQACTAVAVDAARAELVSAGATARAEADSRAKARLDVAVDGARMWASTNYVDGMPSFAGLPGEVAPGVFTVAHSSVEVVLEARTADGGCARAAVTAGGFVTELTCP